ncbi:MAG: hypothetical protein U0K91_06150, partial [Acutalibacteraceae bacterium]|nr:hypothetical protein [Acutalibacteraceae bacterium]
YRILVKDADGNEVYNDWYLPRYYSATVDETNTVNIGKLAKGEYTVTITAETVYGVKSAPVEANFSK